MCVVRDLSKRNKSTSSHCVLVAVQKHQADGRFETVVGVAVDPIRQDVFAAAKGRGATCNGAPMHVSRLEDLSQSVVSTGLPGSSAPSGYEARLMQAKVAVRGMRILGCAGLDLAYVASGRLGAYWKHGLSIWDVSAGGLLVTEAGGLVTTLDGREINPMQKKTSILAANERLHSQITSIVGESSNPRG
jgi:myo-inositol-1(or 4)-monophosphatase